MFYSQGQRDARKLTGSIDIKRNDPYNMEEMVMPLQEYINDPRAHELIHNGETFQVLALLNLTSCSTSIFFLYTISLSRLQSLNSWSLTNCFK